MGLCGPVPVNDSKSGPRRGAADLGIMDIAAGKRTRTAAGGLYEPERVRVLASRFPIAPGAKASRGVIIDGFQVELFCCELDEQRWTAADAVALYFGRAAQENRFAQEDRELGTDRIVSYHLPGQELATLVALGMYNLQICEGFASNPPPTTCSEPDPTPAQPDERAPKLWPLDPVLQRALTKAPWTDLLAKRPGWSFDAVTATLRCPEGQPLHLMSVRGKEHAKGRTGVIFGKLRHSCDGCARRPACLRSDDRAAAKHLEVSLPSDIADLLRDRLGVNRALRRLPLPLPKAPTAAGRSAHQALFLPAVARKAFAKLFDIQALTITVTLPPVVASHPMVAANAASVQRRRLSWRENLARYALPAGARVEVELVGSTWQKAPPDSAPLRRAA